MHRVHRLARQQFDLRLACIAKQRTTLFTAQRSARQLVNLRRERVFQRCLQRCSLCHVSCPRLLSCHLRHNTSRHDRPRPFHIAYGRSRRSMAASPIRALINHGSCSKHKFCRKLCLRHYLGLRISAGAFLLAPFCSLTLAGTVVRESNAPTAATSARANNTTSCGDGSPELREVIFACLAAQLNIAKGRCFTESRFLCNCFSLSSTTGNTPS